MILTTGLVLFFIGLALIRFPEFCQQLKALDPQQWQRLDSPLGYSFIDQGKTIGLFSWLLAGDYKNLNNEQLAPLAQTAYQKAVWAKYLMLSGIAVSICALLSGLFLR